MLVKCWANVADNRSDIKTTLGQRLVFARQLASENMISRIPAITKHLYDIWTLLDGVVVSTTRLSVPAHYATQGGRGNGEVVSTTCLSRRSWQARHLLLRHCGVKETNVSSEPTCEDLLLWGASVTGVGGVGKELGINCESCVGGFSELV